LKYSIILSDCPWHYNARNNPKNTKFGKGASGHYQTMHTGDICNIAVNEITADNCALFLWATMPRLPDALRVMNAWGFTYKTVGFTWMKINKGNREPFFGIGYYTKSCAEICLLGIKGKMKPVSNYVSQMIVEPRRGHSQKPLCTRERIVQLFGDLPRLELFSREKVDGWDSIGDDINGLDIREVLRSKFA